MRRAHYHRARHLKNRRARGARAQCASHAHCSRNFKRAIVPHLFLYVLWFVNQKQDINFNYTRDLILNPHLLKAKKVKCDLSVNVTRKIHGASLDQLVKFCQKSSSFILGVDLSNKYPLLNGIIKFLHL